MPFGKVHMLVSAVGSVQSMPRPGSRFVTQEDFPMIIEKTRQANAETFGAGADAP